VLKRVVHIANTGLLRVNMCVGYPTLQQSFELLEGLATAMYIISGHKWFQKLWIRSRSPNERLTDWLRGWYHIDVP
jgi:hypothetical protein